MPQSQGWLQHRNRLSVSIVAVSEIAHLFTDSQIQTLYSAWWLSALEAISERRDARNLETDESHSRNFYTYIYYLL